MAKIKSIILTDDERTALERASRQGKTHEFRLRCRMILLKAQCRTSADVAQELGCCEVIVNTWLKCYQQHGLAGLHSKARGGRRAILQTETDLEAIRRAVQSSRQRISLAKAELEQELGKEFSALTLKRFLKKTIAAGNVSGEP